MHVYEVIPCTYEFLSYFFSKTYSTCYFRKQQNETGYFCGMTLFFIIEVFSLVQL